MVVVVERGSSSAWAKGRRDEGVGGKPWRAIGEPPPLGGGGLAGYLALDHGVGHGLVIPARNGIHFS